MNAKANGKSFIVRQLILSGLMVAGFSAVIGTQDTASAAGLTAAGPPKTLSEEIRCANQNADATKTMGPGVRRTTATGSASTYSNSNRSCQRFLLDVSIPHNSSGWNGDQPVVDITTAAPIAGVNTAAQCNALRVSKTIYKKSYRQLMSSNPPPFKKIATAEMKGDWRVNGGTGHCYLAGLQGATGPTTYVPPHEGKDVYRVAIKAQTGNQFKNVTVVSQHPILEPPR